MQVYNSLNHLSSSFIREWFSIFNAYVTLSGVKFTDKLRRLIEGKNKAELAQSVKLKPTVISDYARRGYAPRLDIALKISRALNVPLDWLADDSREWPPPPPSALSAMSVQQLTGELGRRMQGIGSLLLVKLERARKVDWIALAKKLQASAGEEELPPEMREWASFYGQITTLFADLNEFFPEIVVGSNIPAELSEQLNADDIFSFREIVELFLQVHRLPGFGAAQRLLGPYTAPKNWRGPWFKQHMEYQKGMAAEELADDELRVKVQNGRTESRRMVPELSQSEKRPNEKPAKKRR